MKPVSLFLTVLSIIFMAQFTSCKKEGNNDTTNISRHGLTESHNTGLNCMNCHKNGGEGQGWFTAAGTLYDSTGLIPSPNGTVTLYSGPNGTGNVIKTIDVDGKGNFYTTESLDFSGMNIYPSIAGTSGKKQYMSTRAASGACNSCHTGSPIARIWIN